MGDGTQQQATKPTQSRTTQQLASSISISPTAMKDLSLRSHHDESEREGPGEHVDLAKQHKKLLNYYDDVSVYPIQEARFSQTYLARHKKSGEYRSVMILPRKKIPPHVIKKQIDGYQQLLHPNILHLYETLEDRKNTYFIMDRLDHPNIYEVIPKIYPDSSKFDQVQVALLIRIILRALQYCHARGFAHTALSYHNILVDPKRGSLRGLYIAGFGHAVMNREMDAIYKHQSQLHRRIEEDDDDNNNDDSSSNSDDGEDSDNNNNKTVIEMAPNDLFAAPETRAGDLSVFEEPSDIWAVGIITFQLLTRHHPFEDPHVRPRKFRDLEWVDNFFATHPYLERVSPSARDFVKQLMTYKDTDRITATQALEHEWLREVDQVKGTERKEALQDCLSNLQNFDAKNKLEQAARLYIASNLLYGTSAKRSLDSVFHHLDKVLVDGVISRDELKVALEKAHGKGKSAKVQQLLTNTFDRVDVNKDGVIEYAEFMAAAADDSLLLTRENLRETFDNFDVSKTGTITVDDLKALCNRNEKIMSKRDARKLMRQVDLDGDGEITFAEFCALMQG
ncbi:Calcium-dependent protein kinase [Seminavis robusta]|uniref:Calcium-dependent protein kinase n=1 Tax=Seminavis robusta TaxID=568900 RepID=A0A9N8HK06_9STRA|nr:Calcium-dependent protein kinase [Seminavis robusta]|eukprot:Sro903_g218270.1 Calcium-dependent protein kinase (565) ;mRNA; f:19550-21497